MADYAEINKKLSEGIFHGRIAWALTAVAGAIAGGYIGQEVGYTALGTVYGGMLGVFAGFFIPPRFVRYALRKYSVEDVVRSQGY